MLLFAVPVILNAGEVNSEVFYFHYRLGKSDIDLHYLDNARTLIRLDNFLHIIEKDPDLSINKIYLTGSVSPEGPRDVNLTLVDRRLQQIEQTLRDRYDVMRPDVIVERSYQGVDAVERLADKNFWPGMRSATVRFAIEVRPHEVIIPPEAFDIPRLNIPLLAEEPYIAPAPALTPIRFLTIPRGKNPYHRQFLLKTNTLGWCLLIPNISAELEIGHHWSLALPVYYSSLDYFSQKIKFRTLTIQPELRYWFHDPYRKGRWFIGVHFGAGYYNYALNSAYRIQDHNGSTPAIGGGISTGYSMRLSRNSRWRMEFSLGAGVYQCKYDKFLNQTNGAMVASGIRKRVFCIDNASVSLSLSLNPGKR